MPDSGLEVIYKETETRKSAFQIYPPIRHVTFNGGRLIDVLRSGVSNQTPSKFTHQSDT